MGIDKRSDEGRGTVSYMGEGPVRLNTGDLGVRFSGGEDVAVGDVCVVYVEYRDGVTFGREIKVLYSRDDENGDTVFYGCDAEGLDHRVSAAGVHAGAVSVEASNYATQLYQLIQREDEVADELLLSLAMIVWPELEDDPNRDVEGRRGLVESYIGEWLQQDVGEPKLGGRRVSEGERLTAEGLVL